MALIHIETRSKNLPDSGAWQIHKFGTATGEQRIALEGNCETDTSLFDFYTKDVDFYFYTKTDMLDYISAIQEEINHPTQKYTYKDYPSFYKEKIKEINDYPSDFIVMHFAPNPRRGGTAYLASVSTEDSDKYNFLRSICLSSEKQGKKNAYTTFLFVKYQNTATGKYYINLVPTFSKTYTMEELSTILKREIENAKDVYVAINLFGLKYADQILKEEYDCQELMNAAGYEEDEYVSELETAIMVYENLKDNKVTINPISDKLGLLGAYIENDQPLKRLDLPNDSRQRIYYGAPGTGKSHSIKNDARVKVADKKNLVFRTTFHPDSDYSTFVGAYKPTMKPVADKYKAVAGKDEEIAYEFVPQAFLQAYIAAWNNQEENVFLVIEEINRGNCAQIFGDLFQLLDRDDEGLSEYPIKADTDLAKYLCGKDEKGNDVLVNKDGIKDGKLKLPKNLYILATMNTSDQSLFPIDSAFKRRWDWTYIPIKKSETDNYKMEINGVMYNWWSFVDQMNKVVEKATESEDKKMGYYFCKPDKYNDVISAKKFVSKVLFYLYNDVFRDNGLDWELDGLSVFKYTNGKGKEEVLTFAKYYKPNGNPDEDQVERLITNLKVKLFDQLEEANAESDDEEGG